MSKLDIYVKVSILINYKTKQSSNLASSISLTSWLCDIGIPFSVCLSILLSQHLSRSSKFTSKYSNQLQFYNNHHTLHDTSPWPPDSAGTWTQWPWPIFCAPVTLTQFNIPDLLNYKAYNYQTLHSAFPRCTDLAGTLTWWPWPIFCASVTLTHFASTFNISSTIRPTTIKPCKVLLLNVLTRHIPWPADLDLYFGCSDFDIIYVNVPDLLKCKTSSHQTLHSASPRCTDSAGTLARWPWPIFCAPVHFTHFTSMFNISSTIRPTTTKPWIVLLLNVRTAGDLTRWPWPIFRAPLTFTHVLHPPSICSQL